MFEYATSIFSLNKPLVITEHTHAMFRRIMLVPFNVTISESEKDRELAQKIISSEMSGILNLVVEGARSLLANGKFDIPQTVIDAVEDFRMESDTVLAFAKENGYRHSSTEWIYLSTMYSHYLSEHPKGVSKNDFARQLRSHGFEVKRAKERENTVSVYATRQSVIEMDETHEADKIDDEYTMFEEV
jgi:putative DNA primase/helicase